MGEPTARSRGLASLVALVAVGVLALTAAGWLGLRALDERGSAQAADRPERSARVASDAREGREGRQRREARGNRAERDAEVPMRTVRSGAGYVLQAPSSFRVGREGEHLSLTSRDRRIVVAVGPGASGSLEDAHARLSDSVVAAYDSANLEVTRPLQVGDRPALRTVGSVARGGSGLVVTLTTVRQGGRTLDATVFTARDITAGEVRRLVAPTLSSLRFAD